MPKVSFTSRPDVAEPEDAARGNWSALRRENAELSRMFETSLDLLLITDRRGRFLRVSPSCLAIIGYRPEEMIGRSGREFLYPGDLERTRNELRLARRGHIMRNFESSYVHKNGRLVTLAWTGAWSEPEQRHFFIGRDMTELKRAEQLKDEFVSTVSHELRTPLTAIAASLTLLKSGGAGALPDGAARLVAIASANGERLVRLVNDILDIGKTESGLASFNFQPVELRALVEAAVEASRTLAGETGVRLRFSADLAAAVVRADADRVTQAVTNLLSNAIKHSPPGGDVVIAMVLRGDTVRLTVRDHGPGIPEEFRARIFQKFAQARDDRRKGGTGLGLSIVKQIIDRLGGKIGFDSASGRGALFWFELPLMREEVGP